MFFNLYLVPLLVKYRHETRSEGTQKKRFRYVVEPLQLVVKLLSACVTRIVDKAFPVSEKISQSKTTTKARLFKIMVWKETGERRRYKAEDEPIT